MGTEPLSDVLVFLKDETDNEMLDTARVSFSGLNTDSCYRQDRALAVFDWIPDSISGMFEGVLSTAISGSYLMGDLSLNVDGNLPIDTDLYRNLSFAAVCMNSNPNATPGNGAVAHLWWIDSSGDTTSVNISNEIGAIRNGNTEWREYGPLDLSSVSGLNWGDADAVELWLSFRTGKPPAPAVPQPVDIRRGWVKLTE